MTTYAQQRVSETVQDVAALREHLHAAETAEERQAIRAALEAAKTDMVAAWSVADCEWYASLGPVQMRLLPEGDIRCVRSAAAGGGQSWTVGRRSPHYAAALSLIRAQGEQDAAVAAVAFAAWACTPHAVRIDYYGTDLAVVTDGGRKCRVDLPTMTAR